MVFTSDGYNMYQGSGFFINQDGLAVSNYHVFKGTGIGNEGIKLAESDEIYKVVEVIKSSEDEDFILFRVKLCQNKDFYSGCKIQTQCRRNGFCNWKSSWIGEYFFVWRSITMA